jgi:hypothetical protein
LLIGVIIRITARLARDLPSALLSRILVFFISKLVNIGVEDFLYSLFCVLPPGRPVSLLIAEVATLERRMEYYRGEVERTLFLHLIEVFVNFLNCHINARLQE